tara:strand:+ start:328 stop:645 length:318 start_codon:yes stop_codon:yes gene_type:complete
MKIDYEYHPEDQNLVKARIVYQTYSTEILTDNKGRIKLDHVVSPTKKYIEGWIPLNEWKRSNYKLGNWIETNWGDSCNPVFCEVDAHPIPDILNYELLNNDGTWE